ncbi:MAG TPA: hypothetical protein VK983_04780 [Candidatus Limnocylindrales bacterium]|nr:hypothetical protein [Candidatus Limnocylindrales bacterium]
MDGPGLAIAHEERKIAGSSTSPPTEAGFEDGSGRALVRSSAPRSLCLKKPGRASFCYD